MSFLAWVKKSGAVAVAPYERGGRPVRSHIRHDPRAKKKRPSFTAEQRALIRQKYPELSDMAWASVNAYIAKGYHIMFPDDAHLDALEQGMQALARWNARKGDWRRFVWQQIKAAVKHHWVWERSRGLGGRKYLYNRYLDLPEEERKLAINRLPNVGGGNALARASAPSAEEALQHGAQLLRREEVLAKVEHEFGANLRKVGGVLSRQEPLKRGRKQLEVERALRIFEMRVRGYSFREIARRLLVDVAVVHRSYKKIQQAMRQMGAGMEKSVSVDDRLARAFARHLCALQYGYPAEFMGDNRKLLIKLLADMTDGPWA